MKNIKKIVRTILLGVLLIAGVWGYSFYYQTTHFFITEDSQIAANMVFVTPEITGKVLTWNIKEGDLVNEGQLLGKQDVTMLTNDNLINSSLLSKSADTLVSKSEIIAPIAGKVIRTEIVNGQVVTPGLEVAVIADTEHIYVKANIEETDIFKILVGQEVDIRIDAFGNRKFKGYVESIGQATESVFSPFPSLNTSGNFTKQTQLIPIKISIINGENLILMPGMNTKVKIRIK